MRIGQQPKRRRHDDKKQGLGCLEGPHETIDEKDKREDIPSTEQHGPHSNES